MAPGSWREETTSGGVKVAGLHKVSWRNWRRNEKLDERTAKRGRKEANARKEN
jgi:hypothetical protein